VAIAALFVAVCLPCLTSCEIDSLPEPEGIVAGTIRDVTAADGIYWTEQPSGFEINCHEDSWTGSETVNGQSFQGKADGTFYSCRIFAGTYTITPTQGAFHSVKGQTMEIRSNVETALTFDVIPYCTFHDVLIEKDPVTAGTVVIKFNVTTNPVADDPATDTDESVPATIRNWRLFATSRTPYVGANIFDADVSTSSDQPLTTADLGTADDLGRQITYSRAGFKAGTTYYLRLGARCKESTNDRYNMTKIVTISF
jgi:hypothetical protein